jgi:hypothetical protein
MSLVDKIEKNYPFQPELSFLFMISPYVRLFAPTDRTTRAFASLTITITIRFVQMIASPSGSPIQAHSNLPRSLLEATRNLYDAERRLANQA